MDPRTLVMTSGPEELPFQQNELFESDFSNAVAQVNFELSSEPCLGDLSSGYDGEKGSWGQPWQGGDDRLASHLPIKAQCDSLDMFCNELASPGYPLFSTITNEIFGQEGDLSTSSSLEFNFMNSGMAQAPQAAVKKDTDQNILVGDSSNEQVHPSAAEPVGESNPKDLMTPCSRQTGSCNGEPCGDFEVAPERLDCDEEMETQVEENEGQSTMDLDFSEATGKYPLFSEKDADQTTRTDVDDAIRMNGDGSQIVTNDVDGPIPSNGADDFLPTNNVDDSNATNEEDNEVTSEDRDDLVQTDEGAPITRDDEADPMAPEMMEQDPHPNQNPGNDVSKPPSPLNPVAIEMNNTRPLRETLEPLSGVTSPDTEEPITDPNEVKSTAPLADEQSPVASLKRSHQMYGLHPVVIIHQNEPVNPTSHLFRCAACKHLAKSTDLLIEHHYKCHPISTHGAVAREAAQRDMCNVANASSPRSTASKETFKGPYYCEKCRINFTKIHKYVSHMREHTGKTPYVCDICGRYFAQAGGVKRHQQQTRLCHPLNRVGSAKNLSQKTSPRAVAAEPSGENMPECYVLLRKITKVHECNYCRKTFLSLVKARKHQHNAHKGASSYIITKHILKQEDASPESEYTFKCPLCPRFFKYSFNRGRHLRKCLREKLSEEKVGNKYPCPMCPTTFTFPSNRYRHIQSFCLRKTISRLSMEEFKSSKHTEQVKVNGGSPKSGTHRGESESKKCAARKATLLKSAPKFKCRFCPAAYHHGSGLYRHMKKHRLAMLTSDKVRYTALGEVVAVVNKFETSKAGVPRCRVCRKHFTTWASVRTHEIIHRDKSHQCTKCERRFRSHAHLIEHRSVHQGRMLCTACLKVLPTIGELMQHCKLHHQSGSLRCPDCLQYYKDLTTFIWHLETLNIDTKGSQTPDQEDRAPKLPSDNTGRPSRKTVLQNARELTQTEPKPVSKCNICRAEFTKKHMLFGHLLGHKLNTLIKCQSCGRCFGRKRIQFHFKKCRNDPPPPPKVKPPVAESKDTFKCSICPRAFGKKYHLYRHLGGHDTNSLVLCKTCGQYFGKSKFHLHKRICSQRPEEPSAPAPIEVPDTPAPIEVPDTLAPIAVPTAPAAIPAAVSIAAQTVPPPPKGTYPCTFCPRLLGKKDRLLAHLIGHEKNTLASCPLGCGQYFSRRKLPAHENRCIMSLKPKVKSEPFIVPDLHEPPSQSVKKKPLFKCLHCNRQFRFKSLLLRHSVTHSGLQPYLCFHCGDRFPSRLLARQHQEMYHKVKPDYPVDDHGTKESCDPSLSQVESPKSPKKADSKYKCTFCNKCFLKARNLRNHILTHNEAKPYRCKSCRSSFSRFDHLKVHQASCKVKKMRLEICIPKLSLEDVAKGWKSSPDKGPMESEETPQCKFCFKMFPALSSLNRHVTLFHSVKQFKCKQCNSAFSHEKSLKFHIKRNCKSILKRRSLGNISSDPAEKPLDKLRNVTPKRPPADLMSTADHTCTYCSLSFASAYSLKNHMRFHSGVWPFSCQYCGERFPRKDYVQRHLLKCAEFLKNSQEPSGSSQDKAGDDNTTEQKSDRGFSCAYCSARFSLFSQLQEHFLNVHQLETADRPVTTASLQHHLSNMSDLDKDSDHGQHDEKLGSTSNLTCELDSILTVEASGPFHCMTCGKTLKNFTAYQSHLRVHSAPYLRCNVCRKGFWNKLAFRKHKKKCKAEGVPAGNYAWNSEAEVDQTAADTEPSLNISSEATTPSVVVSTKSKPEKSGKSQKEEVRYQCSECHKSFTDGLLLITHLEDHRREELEKQRHACSTCGKVCGSQANLLKHMRIHVNDKKYSCPDCTKVLNTQSELDNHRACHDPMRAYACKLCTYRFNSRQTLREHYAEEHPNDVFMCRFCNQTYSAESSLLRHYKKHHKNEVKTNVPPLAGSQQSVTDDSEDLSGEDSDSDTAPYFPCHVCGKTFTTSESLEDHQRCHLGEKPHECAECGKCFFLAGQLEHHQRMHKSEFQCQLCGKGFVSQFALRKHKNTHGKSRPHRCTKCQLTFTGASQLAEHMASHREENFPCDICDRVFNSKSSRFEHRKTHTSEAEAASGQKACESAVLPLAYRCGDCNKRFGESEALLEHGCVAAEERQHKCSACHKHFLYASHLIKHLSAEHPDVECSTDSLTLDLKKELDHSTDFTCSVCGLCFANGDELNKHFSTHSGEIFFKKEEPSTSEAKIHCSVCDRSFLGSKAYEVHVCARPKPQLSKPPVKNAQVALQAAGEDDEVDVISGDPFNCTDCTVSFPSQSALLEHRTVLHEASKPYKCRLCQKAFAFRRYLQKHMKRHLAKHDSASQSPAGEKAFRCDQCGVAVASEQELSLHMSLHVERGEGCYSCDLCLESFKHWSLFKRHQESHMGQVVYECNECDKAFAFPDLLEEHQQMHASHR